MFLFSVIVLLLKHSEHSTHSNYTGWNYCCKAQQ